MSCNTNVDTLKKYKEEAVEYAKLLAERIKEANEKRQGQIAKRHSLSLLRAFKSETSRKQVSKRNTKWSGLKDPQWEVSYHEPTTWRDEGVQAPTATMSLYGRWLGRVQMTPFPSILLQSPARNFCSSSIMFPEPCRGWYRVLFGDRAQSMSLF